MKRRFTCLWAEDEDSIWQTSCGSSFEFIDGKPSDNHMKFCCYCGKELKEAKYAD